MGLLRIDEGKTIEYFLCLLLIDHVNDLAGTLKLPHPIASGEIDTLRFYEAFRLIASLKRLFLNAPAESAEGRLKSAIIDYLCTAAVKSLGSEEDIRSTITAVDAWVDEEDEFFDPRQYFAPLFLPYAHGIWLLSQSMDRHVAEKLIRRYFTIEQGPIGWPDITLIGNGRVGFCEVKDLDKLHRSQIEWWSDVAPFFDGNAWIGKVTYG